MNIETNKSYYNYCKKSFFVGIIKKIKSGVVENGKYYNLSN